MKKTVAFLLVFALLLPIVPALAAGQLEVLKENFWVFQEEYGTYAYFYAKVWNKGDQPISIDECFLTIKDDQGEVLVDNDWAYVPCAVLQPKEYTYLIFNEFLDEGVTVGEVSVSYKGSPASEYYTVTSFESEGQLAEEEISYLDVLQCVLATVANPTDKPLYDLCVVAAVLDEKGNILYVDCNSSGSTGPAPGSTIVFRFPIYDFFLKDRDLETLTVDTLAYLNE